MASSHPHTTFRGSCVQHRHTRCLIGFCLALLLQLTPAFGADAIDLSAAEFKAATLYKMLPYIEWEESDAPLIVAILGEDPFEGLLGQLLQGQKIKGRNVTVKVVPEASQLDQCDLLFVSSRNLPLWDTWSQLHSLAGVLTVSDTEEFVTSKGGVACLSFSDRKISVNVKTAKAQGLKINPKLLRIASVVKN